MIITTIHIYIIPLTQKNQTFPPKVKNNTLPSLFSASFNLLSFFPHVKLCLPCQLNITFICLFWADRVQASSSDSQGGEVCSGKLVST